MDDKSFLIARIEPQAAASGSLDWVPTEGRPYHSIDPLDLDETAFDAVFDMYSREYTKLGSKLNIPDRDGLLEYNRWILIEYRKGILRGFALLKTTPFGAPVQVMPARARFEKKKDSLFRWGAEKAVLQGCFGR